ncbi:unnamed protein product, partial [Porites evermanni]
KCHHGYKGQRCLTRKLGFVASNPGLSCKHIRDAGDSIGDGEYWIDPENNRNPFKVYCDMTTDGGYFFIFTSILINELKTSAFIVYLHQNYAKQGRTFHVITAANSTGEAVVQYFSGQSDTLPASCGSFITMEDDNSELAIKCSKWGNDGSHYVGKWGHHRKQGEFRMYDHTAFIANLHYWIIFNRMGKCDEGAD